MKSNLAAVVGFKPRRPAIGGAALAAAIQNQSSGFLRAQWLMPPPAFCAGGCSRWDLSRRCTRWVLQWCGIGGAPHRHGITGNLAAVLNHPQLPFAAFEHQFSWLPRQRRCKQRGQYSQHNAFHPVMCLIVRVLCVEAAERPLEKFLPGMTNSTCRNHLLTSHHKLLWLPKKAR